ncbi:thiamine diphosphokinase [bacterium]|nr:thiamine diphosphokinase [bacterium]
MTATKKTALIILNGEKPSKELLEEFWQKTELKVCADGAADMLLAFHLEPDIILGDLDSISQEIQCELSSVRIIKMLDQNKTDGEKAIKYCIDNGFSHLFILGALGKRIDHTLYNLELLKKMNFPGVEISLFSEEDEAFLAQSKKTLRAKVGARISLFPLFGKVHGVTSLGLKYPLNNDTLEMGRFSSLSNEFVEDSATINLSSGALLVVIERNKNS